MEERIASLQMGSKTKQLHFLEYRYSQIWKTRLDIGINCSVEEMFGRCTEGVEEVMVEVAVRIGGDKLDEK